MAQNWAGSCGNLIASLRKRIGVAMEICKTDKLKAGFRTVSLTKAEPKLIIDNLDVIPDEFIRVEYQTIEKVQALKEEILAAIREGKTVEGAKMSDPEIGIRVTKARGKKEEKGDENNG